MIGSLHGACARALALYRKPDRNRHAIWLHYDRPSVPRAYRRRAHLLQASAMALQLHPPHRIAKYNHAVRTGAFAFSFVTFALLWVERGQAGVLEIIAAVLTLVAYPHLAYVYTRLAADAKRAEQNNLYLDAVILGAWAAQIHFALWPSVGLLIAICLNAAAYGYVARLLRTLALFAASAAAWGLLNGYAFTPDTGPLVTAVTMVGIVLYASAVGLVVFRQNKDLVREHHALLASEQQFRFISDNVSDLVAMLDPRGAVLYANDRYATQFGAEAVSTGADWLRLVHAEERSQAGDFLLSVLTTGTSRSMPLRMVSATGTWYLIECKANPVLSEAGKAVMIVLICKDLSRLLNS